MFKNYIKTILEYKKNNNLLTHHTMKTLEKDLRRDITDAFEIAKPYILENLDLYENSSSFLDFLFKLMNIDLMTIHPVPNTNNITEKLPQSIESLQDLVRKMIDDCSNKNFFNSIEEDVKQHLELISSKMSELNNNVTQRADVHNRNKKSIEKIENMLCQMTNDKIDRKDLDDIKQNVSEIKNVFNRKQLLYENIIDSINQSLKKNQN